MLVWHSMAKTNNNIKRVQLAINEDHQLPVQELADDLGMVKRSVWGILTEDLQMVLMRVKFILKLLRMSRKLSLCRVEITHDTKICLKRL